MSNEKWVKEYISKMLDLNDNPNLDLEKEIIAYKGNVINQFGGKLYRYCPLPDMYNITNFLSDITYFNSPSRFNDPFDCAMGICDEELFDFLTQQLFDIDLIKSYMKDAERKTKNISINSQDDVRLLLKSLPKEFKEIIDIFINDKDIINYYKGKINDKDIKDKVINKLSSEKFLNFTMKTLKVNLGYEQKNQLRSPCFKLKNCLTEYYEERDLVFSLTNLYDIMEKVGYSLDLEQFKNQFNNIVKDLVNKHKSDIDKSFKVSCFTTSPKNQFMWSHYANKHQGFCLEYDFANLDKEYNKFLIGLFPVKYTKMRPKIMFDCYKIKDGEMEFNFKRKHKKHILQSLRTKSDIWKKENEWRILLVNEPKNIIKLPIISKIFLGANISEEDKALLIGIAKNKKIEYKVMKISNDTFSLN